MPDRFVVHVQANLTALVNPANGRGSAMLQVNSREVYNSTTVNQTGEVSFPWMPDDPTRCTFVVNFTNCDGSNGAQAHQSLCAFQQRSATHSATLLTRRSSSWRKGRS